MWRDEDSERRGCDATRMCATKMWREENAARLTAWKWWVRKRVGRSEKQ